MSTEVPDTPPAILLSHYLKTLKLPTFQREYQKLGRLTHEAEFGPFMVVLAAAEAAAHG